MIVYIDRPMGPPYLKLEAEVVVEGRGGGRRQSGGGGGGYVAFCVKSVDTRLLGAESL
jgi:hypothetical protein